MKASLRKIGNSAGAIIPSYMLKKRNLKIGEAINIIEDGVRIIIEPASIKPKYTLNELLKQCDSKAAMPNELKAWDEINPTGNEIL